MNILSFLSKDVFPVVLNISWQVSVMIVLIWLLSAVFKKSSPVFRYYLWMIVLLRLCIPFEINLPFSLMHEMKKSFNNIAASEPQTVSSGPNQPAGNQNSLIEPDDSLLSRDISGAAAIPHKHTQKLSLMEILSIAWVSIFLLFIVFILYRVLKLRSSLIKSAPVEREELLVLFRDLCRQFALKKEVRLLYTEAGKSDVPAAIGILKPCVLMPCHIADKWAPADIHPVLLHELAHIKRYDLLINWIQIIVQAVYFFNPFVWIANWKIRELREEICDDIAILNIGSEKKRYGNSIIKVMEEINNEPAPGYAGAGFLERKNSLARRIIRIMDTRYKISGKTSILSFVIIFAIALACFAAAGGKTPDSVSQSENSQNQDAPASGNIDIEKVQRDILWWNFDKAIMELTKYLRTTTSKQEEARINLLLAEAYYIKGIEYRNAEARYDSLQYYNKAISLNPEFSKEGDVLKNIAYLETYRQSAGHCDTVKDKAREALAKNTDSAEANFYLGIIEHFLVTSSEYTSEKEIQDKLRESSLQHLKKATDLNPAKFIFHAYYITALFNADKKEEARKAADKMLKYSDLKYDGIISGISDPYEMYSALLEPEKVAEYLTAKSAEHPDDVKLQFVVINTFQNDIAAYRKKLEDFTSDIDSGKIKISLWDARIEPKALYKLAHAYNQEGNLEKSLNTYLRIIERSPLYAETRYNCAVIYYKMAQEKKDPEEKYSLLKKAYENLEIQIAAAFHDSIEPSKSLLEKVKNEIENIIKENPEIRNSPNFNPDKFSAMTNESQPVSNIDSEKISGTKSGNEKVSEQINLENELPDDQNKPAKSKSSQDRLNTILQKSQSISKDILQRDNKDLRNAAIEKAKQALITGDDEEKAVALRGLKWASSAKFDKTQFRELLIPLLKSEDEFVRVGAMACLVSFDLIHEQLDIILPLVDDPSPVVRKDIGTGLKFAAKNKYPEKVIPALTKLLKDPDEDVVVTTIRGMWGEYSSPEFDKLLIEMSNKPEYHGYIIYHALSTKQTKSIDVCKRLVTELNEPDWNKSGRAAWGLGYGVEEDARPIVEDGLLKAISEETQDIVRKDEFNALKNVATEKSREYLLKVVNSSEETDEYKKMANEILDILDKRKSIKN